MWIPFISVFLLKQLQPLNYITHSYTCCEFLSFRYFYWSNYNVSLDYRELFEVVNSFHFGIFTEAITTHGFIWTDKRELWIPFISVFLLKQLQLLLTIYLFAFRCEFLSFRYFYWSNYNEYYFPCIHTEVVNSFHFGIFTEAITTLV